MDEGLSGILFLLILAACIFPFVWLYSTWLERGIRHRRFCTSLPPDRIRDIFVQKVASTGWSVVDDGNPMVAQSPLITGIRQQIRLTLQEAKDGRVSGSISVERWLAKHGTPTKGHTLRLRMEAFCTAVQREDPTATIKRA
ncbi:MAG: hypothetical protein LBJ02_05290 [Bifidobacteriaceae bacterium]|jgi:hypothetical protein|nr:hypothetical protein [Bifidobacteriaceae bacterium]